MLHFKAILHLIFTNQKLDTLEKRRKQKLEHLGAFVCMLTRKLWSQTDLFFLGALILGGLVWLLTVTTYE